MRSSGDFLKIGTANSAGVHTEKEFAATDFRHGNGFQTDVIDSAVNCGQHRRRNRLIAVFDCDLSGNPHRALDEIQVVFASTTSFNSREEFLR